MHDSAPFYPYKRALIKNFNRVAKSFDSAAILPKEIGQRLLERLRWMPLSPLRILDLGCGTGTLAPFLAQHYPEAEIILCDLAQSMLQIAQKKYGDKTYSFLIGDGDQLPLQTHSIDLVISNGALAWYPVPNQIFQEIQRILKPGGALFFSTLGPDTLKELRHCREQRAPLLNAPLFIDMHETGDQLLKHQFQDPVMDREVLTLHYQTSLTLIQDLTDMGLRMAYPLKGFWHSQKTLLTLKKDYECFRTPEGYLPLTVEVIYGHALASAVPFLQKADENGHIHFGLHQLHRL